jgi:NAD(P)-dependent dehydrogenase (short-subunit alcohol dehydrogenase family)
LALFRVTGLRDKVCLITGSGRGIGRFLAETFAAEGAALALAARTEEQLDEVAAGLRRKHQTETIVAALDVGRSGAMSKFAERVGDRFGKVDVIVNNAAVVGPVGELATVDLKEWRSALMINVAGIAETVAAFVPLMPAGGRVINLSGAGVGGPQMPARVSAYSVSKTAVVSLTETLAVELAPRGITVNAVAPGAQATTFLQPVIDAGPERAGAEFHQAALGASASEINLAAFADLVLYLIGEGGGWLTGRLLSARWESPAVLEARRLEGMSASLFKLRRVDGDTFFERQR